MTNSDFVLRASFGFRISAFVIREAWHPCCYEAQAMNSRDIMLHLTASPASSLALFGPLLVAIAIVATLAFTGYLLGCYAQERRFRRHVTRRKERSREVWRMRLTAPGSPEWQALRTRVCQAKVAAAAESVDSAELEEAQAHLLRAA